MMNLPKLILTDIDGVWTDAGMYYDQLGNELKKFTTSDSVGVLFCKILNIPICILTGEETEIVRRRAEKLKIEHLRQGVKNKVKEATAVCKMLSISLEETAFIGDDINDISLLEKVGFSATPANAPAYIKSKVNYVCPVAGGNGAFRNFVEEILKRSDKFEVALSAAVNHYKE